MSEDLESSLLPESEERNVVAKSDPISSTRAEGNLGIVDFISLLQDLLAIDYPSLILVPAYPKYLKVGTKENQETIDNPTQKFKPTITYKVTKREPAAIGGNKQPFGTGTKELVPRPRMRVGNPEGTQTIVYGQNFDNLVTFHTWSLTNTEAEALINWFEQYLRLKRVFFRNQGLGELLFWSRSEDQPDQMLDNRIERRNVTFFVRTEELYTSEEDVLRNLETKLGIRKI